MRHQNIHPLAHKPLKLRNPPPHLCIINIAIYRPHRLKILHHIQHRLRAHIPRMPQLIHLGKQIQKLRVKKPVRIRQQSNSFHKKNAVNKTYAKKTTKRDKLLCPALKRETSSSKIQFESKIDGVKAIHNGLPLTVSAMRSAGFQGTSLSV